MDNREFDPVVPEAIAGPQEDGDELEVEKEDKSKVPLFTLE